MNAEVRSVAVHGWLHLLWEPPALSPARAPTTTRDSKVFISVECGQGSLSFDIYIL